MVRINLRGSCFEIFIKYVTRLGIYSILEFCITVENLVSFRLPSNVELYLDDAAIPSVKYKVGTLLEGTLMAPSPRICQN